MAEEIEHYRLQQKRSMEVPTSVPLDDTNQQWLQEDELMDVDESSDMDIEPEDVKELFVERFEGAAAKYKGGTTFMDEFDNDVHASKRTENLYYPFASRDEWELASYLLRSDLSVASINTFLSLSLIKQLGLSFHTSKELRGRAEMLPKGPEWLCKPWKTNVPTKTSTQLFYRDPLECIQSLLHHPLLKDHMHFTPLRVFETAAKTMRVYNEWMTGDVAWQMQEKLRPGATLLGTILSSDKTNITTMTGGRMAHPLLLSLANINMGFRMKASNNAFVLLALLPVPNFIHPESTVRGMLENRLIHECLDFILQPLKVAAEVGIMMSDPLGQLRYTFTALAAYIVDTPESAVLAGVSVKTSSVTMATYRQLGDSFQHEPRTASTTLAQLADLETIVNPWDLKEYKKLSLEKYHLNGVHRPFWRDWPMAEPCQFLTPEPLHHWHKMFWDHDAKWCIHAVGGAEIDFRFSILHPHTAYRHFGTGISKLNQVTGREHRDIQRYIIAVIAGAVSKKFLIAVRALMDFRYLAQAPQMTEDVCQHIESALKEFHDNKDAIIKTGARTGKKKKVKDWAIPKLEFLQSVVPNIRNNGAAIQWSADITERAHITEIKNPSSSGNNQNLESQICRYLDREDKCRRFDLATAVREARLNFCDLPDNSAKIDDNDEDNEDNEQFEIVNTTASLLSNIDPTHPLTGTTRINADYFQLSANLQHISSSDASHLPRTFLGANTALHLARDPSFKRMSVDDTAKMFNLPDLHCAIIDYLNLGSGVNPPASGRRIATSESPMPLGVKALEVWTKVRLQNHAYYPPHDTLPAQTINVFPPSQAWPVGHSDTVLINTDQDKIWPGSGLDGHCAVQLKLIFRIVSASRTKTLAGAEHFLAYAQQFNIVSQTNRGMPASAGPHPDPVTGMFVLKRAWRSDKTMIGNIIHLSQKQF
ncbi:hypothetical protein BDZ94DRAFT_1316309 [Collybia nuda]|uniref:DUF6830 domain-containing protein n=1 Tax=Collybia nuda TaxID=64659 RepID=A0A9P6CBR3_9AGAR|nr:hypothetical protein BDZ94DRAFT_1316309 [Collybia nuda]